MQGYRVGGARGIPADPARGRVDRDQVLLVVEEQLGQLVREVGGHVVAHHDEIGVGQRRYVVGQAVRTLRDERLVEQDRVLLVDLGQQLLDRYELHASVCLGEQVD